MKGAPDCLDFPESGQKRPLNPSGKASATNIHAGLIATATACYSYDGNVNGIILPSHTKWVRILRSIVAPKLSELETNM